MEAGYPLRGRLAVGRDPFAAPVPTDAVPEPGTAWPDEQLAPGQGITWETRSWPSARCSSTSRTGVALLGIRLGDRLRFQILDHDLEGTVALALRIHP